MVKAIGLDLGKKTLGIAYNDALGFVHGKETFRFPSYEYETPANYVLSLVKERGADIIVIGYPLHLNGTESDMSKNVLSFKELLLSKDPSLKIELVDERLTSVSANNTLSFLNSTHEKRKENVDTLAAVEILETYIRKVNNGK